jgi:hypothetical protein
MHYIANPVIAEAFKIKSIGPINTDGGRQLILDNESRVTATAEMMARMNPQIDDFWVIQSDGYIYLNPQHVFLRKYSEAVQGPDGEWKRRDKATSA